LLRKFPQLKIAAIGPETSKALAVLGLKPTIEAKQHTIDGLVAALLAAQKAMPSGRLDPHSSD
jgi:uroporphyrinogen III methyltransferase/synthase